MPEALSFNKGAAIVLQGSSPDGLYMLHSGSAEILLAPDEFEGLDENILMSRSTRVGTVQGKAVLAGFSRLLAEPYSVSLRALEPCQVAKYPLRPGGLKGVITSDLNQTAALLKSLFQRLGQAQNDLGKALKLYQNVARVNDNINLVYKELSMSTAAPKLVERAEKLHSVFVEKGGAVPQKIDMNFIVSDNGRMLDRRYDLPGFSGEAVNAKFLNMMKGILKLPGAVLQQALKSSPEISLYGYDSMNDQLMVSYRLMAAARKEVHRELADLFNREESWASYLVDQKGYDEWLGSGRVGEDFLKSFLTILSRIETFFGTLYGKKLDSIYEGAASLKGLSHDIEKSIQKEQEAVAVAKSAGSSSGDQLKYTMNQIFEFSLIDKEVQKKLVTLIAEFKELKNPFDTDSDGRKLRRHISKMYWDLYKQVYIRSKSEPVVPLPVKLMLNFGFFDEEMVDEEHRDAIIDIARKREHVPQPWVLRETEFLDLVHAGEEDPSITEMGQSYREFLRDQERYGKSTEDDAGDDELLAKVLYEINQRLTSTSAVCSGSTATAFPIMNSYNMKGDLNNFYVSKRQVVEAIEEILSLDFSAFYRETVFKMGDDVREIIQEEVIPYIIQIPIFGTKILMWQELSGNNKRSRGRIVMPIFFMGDLKKALAEAVAAFRWELNRTMKGGMWADPIEGGITGEYFDYVNTYKKNSKLSQEAKEKIKQKFKSLRNDKDKFADDYVTWLFYEHDGIMKMNAVTREMFFKHVPFVNETRERLGQMPAYSQMANRYKNLNARAIAAYERKFKKYEDESGNLPEEIQKFMDFLSI